MSNITLMLVARPSAGHYAPRLDTPLYRVGDALDWASDGQWSREVVTYATAGDEVLVLGRLAAGRLARIRETARGELEFGQ